MLLFVFSIVKKLSSSKPDDQRVPTAADEQTRRVQEEIRRKIAERRGQPPPRPVTQPVARTVPPPIVAPRPAYDSGGDALRRILAERVRQREAADSKKLADAVLADEADKAATAKAIAMPAAPVSPIRAKVYLGVPEAPVRSASISGLREDLRDPDKLRRAFVLREILGAPVALR